MRKDDVRQCLYSIKLFKENVLIDINMLSGNYINVLYFDI